MQNATEALLSNKDIDMDTDDEGVLMLFHNETIFKASKAFYHNLHMFMNSIGYKLNFDSCPLSEFAPDINGIICLLHMQYCAYMKCTMCNHFLRPIKCW